MLDPAQLQREQRSGQDQGVRLPGAAGARSRGQGGRADHLRRRPFGPGRAAAGALGYLTKDAGAAEIQQALHRVAGGQAALDPAVQLHLVEAIADGPPSGPARLPFPTA